MTYDITQKTFRAPASLLKELDQRAQLETALSGKMVSSSDIIRRGLEHVLAQPLEGMAPAKPCNMITTLAGSVRCLTCGIDPEAFKCPKESARS